MDPKFNEDLIAELLAINQVLNMLLSNLAAVSGDRRLYLSKFLESGTEAMAQTDLWSIPDERKAAVLENARARFAAIVGSISS